VKKLKVYKVLKL